MARPPFKAKRATRFSILNRLLHIHDSRAFKISRVIITIITGLLLVVRAILWVAPHVSCLPPSRVEINQVIQIQIIHRNVNINIK